MAVFSKLTPHPVFFFKDATLYLKSDTTLYRVHASILALYSSFFRDLFSVPQPLDGSAEGTEKSPLELIAVSRAQLTLMLHVFYSKPKLSVLGCLVLLELAARFDMPIVTQYAETELGLRGVPAVLRLQFGLILGKRDWANRAFYALMGQPLHTLDMSDIRLVTPAVYAHVAAAKSLCADYRYEVYSEIPPVQHQNCTDLQACTHAWQLAWCKGFSRLYLNPDQDGSLFFLVAEMEFEKASIPGMGSECMTLTKNLVLNSHILIKESLLIDHAIDKLVNVPLVNSGHLVADSELYDEAPPLLAMAVANAPAE